MDDDLIAATDCTWTVFAFFSLMWLGREIPGHRHHSLYTHTGF